MNAEFKALIERLPTLIGQLRTARKVPCAELSSLRKRPGVYLFWEGPKPRYVGRTAKSLRQRIREQLTEAHEKAAFSMQLTRDELKLPRTYRAEGSRKDRFQNDPQFRAELNRQLLRIRAMRMSWVEVPDALLRFLLECYASFEFRLPREAFEER